MSRSFEKRTVRRPRAGRRRGAELGPRADAELVGKLTRDDVRTRAVEDD